MGLCFSIGRHDLVKPEISKLFFAYRVRHSKDLNTHQTIETFGISSHQQDTSNRKISYQQVLDSAENKDEVFEAMKLISGWSDVQILKDLIKERIELNANQINFEISKEKFLSIQEKITKIKRLISVLYQIHYRRMDFKECYWDLQVIFCKLARLFILRKDQLSPEIRKSLFKTKLSVLNFMISLKDLGLEDSQTSLSTVTDNSVIKKCQINLTDYFKEMGYGKVVREGPPKFEDFNHLRILIRIVNYYYLG